MATLQTEVESQVTELSTEAFKAFCDDVSDMFKVDMECEQKEIVTETVAGLKKRFKKLVSINVVESEGILDGTFQLIFDHVGLFTLGGIVTELPEERIIANGKKASVKLAEGMVDAMGQAGNLLIESWNKVFSEQLGGHSRFSQRLPAFIGKPWDEPEEKIGLVKNEELTFVLYEMTIGSYPAFNCGVIFPKTMSDRNSETDAETIASAQEQDQQENEPQEAQNDNAATEETATAEEDVVQESQASNQEKEDAMDVNVTNNVEEKTTAPEKSKDSVHGGVSETIQKMSQLPAELPGEAGQQKVVENVTVGRADERLEIYAQDIMQKQVVWASPDESVQQALSKMQQHDVGYMMIGQGGELEGIVSRSDIAGAISPYLRPIFTKWRRPSDDASLRIKVKWIMSRPVRTARPETSLATMMENMCRFGGRALPVVDEQGKVLGLVTVFDLFRTLLNTCTDISTVGKTPQAPPLA